MTVSVVTCVLIASIEISSAFADSDPRYLQATEPRRLAFFVGNAEYANVDRLPGSMTDADKVSDVLRALGFKVTPAKNVSTRNEFLTLYLLPFRNSIREGDVVVFYFSGHGFQYGNDNFLTFLQFPRTVKESDLLTTFMPANGIHGLLNDQKPSFLLLLLDACRSIGGTRQGLSKAYKEETL
jgi:uncharacterized caspase-like protein